MLAQKLYRIFPIIDRKQKVWMRQFIFFYKPLSGRASPLLGSFQSINSTASSRTHSATCPPLTPTTITRTPYPQLGPFVVIQKGSPRFDWIRYSVRTCLFKVLPIPSSGTPPPRSPGLHHDNLTVPYLQFFYFFFKIIILAN